MTRPTKRECRHENVFVRHGHYITYAAGVHHRFGVGGASVSVDVRICRGGVDGKPCGHWLSLGPSDETDPRVAVEIRAAELAQDDASASYSEVAGWNLHKLCVTERWQVAPASDGNCAGWLARHIAISHDAEQAGEES